jgi:hypothetical protein
MIPPSSLHCGLKERWYTLYNWKDGDAIRRIQDAFDCCGLDTVKDRAWPFSFNGASTCAKDFGRKNSCFGAWRKEEQIQAGLLLLVAVLVFVVKVLVPSSLQFQSRTQNPPVGNQAKA